MNFEFLVIGNSRIIIMLSRTESRKRIRAPTNPTRDETNELSKEVYEPNKVRVIQLDPILNNMLLSRLLYEFIVEFNTIVGVHRVADYDAKITDNMVFIYLTNHKEFLELLKRRMILIEGRVVNIKDPEMIPGRARYIVPFAIGSDYDIRSTPMPMALFGFRQLPASTTFYVIAVLTALEQRYNTTGFRLAYCDKKKTTRNFGFATFISRAVALQLYEQRFYVLNDVIEAKLPDSVPVLIHKSKANLIENNRCELTEEVREANWLHANLADITKPMRPVAATDQYELPEIQLNEQQQNLPSRDHSPIRAPEATNSHEDSSSKIQEPQPSTSKDSSHHNMKITFKYNERDGQVIRHITPPASPTLSIGEDYGFDEEGELQIPSKKRK